MTDGRTDGQTDGRTDGRTDGGDCNIPIAFLKKRGDKNKSGISSESRAVSIKIRHSVCLKLGSYTFYNLVISIDDRKLESTSFLFFSIFLLLFQKHHPLRCKSWIKVHKTQNMYSTWSKTLLKLQ